MRRLGLFVVRHPSKVLIVSAVFVALAGALGAGVAEHLSTGGFEDPASESTRAAARIEEAFGISDPDVVLLVAARTGSVDDPQVSRAGLALTRELAHETG
ncbi:MAG: MMPL family transporter, partial [Actinomycetota bacterium]